MQAARRREEARGQREVDDRAHEQPVAEPEANANTTLDSIGFVSYYTDFGPETMGEPQAPAIGRTQRASSGPERTSEEAA